MNFSNFQTICSKISELHWYRRVQTWLLPGPPQGVQAARPRHTGLPWLFGVSFLLGDGLFVYLLFSERKIFFILPILGATRMLVEFFSMVSIMRLEFDPEEFRLRVGPRQRWVSLPELTVLTTKQKGAALSLIIQDSHDRELRLNLTLGYHRQDEWGPMLIEAAKRSGAQIGRNVEWYLLDPPSWLR